MNKTLTLTLIALHESRLSDEIYTVLRERELHIPKYKGCSKHLCFRRFLVDWLAVISERLGLSTGILHISVSLLDHTFDKYDDLKGYPLLQLCALCCLWIAGENEAICEANYSKFLRRTLSAKLDEKDNLIPRITTLQRFLSDDEHFFHEDFLSMELSIMQVLDWRLMIPTPVQFLDYFMQDILSDGDLHAGCAITNEERARLYIRKYANYFLGVIIQDHTFNLYLPSLITSASLAASRLCLKITPTWPTHMTTKTSYKYEFLEECVEKLLK